MENLINYVLPNLSLRIFRNFSVFQQLYSLRNWNISDPCTRLEEDFLMPFIFKICPYILSHFFCTFSFIVLFWFLKDACCVKLAKNLFSWYELFIVKRLIIVMKRPSKLIQKEPSIRWSLCVFFSTSCFCLFNHTTKQFVCRYLNSFFYLFVFFFFCPAKKSCIMDFFCFIVFKGKLKYLHTIFYWSLKQVSLQQNQIFFLHTILLTLNRENWVQNLIYFYLFFAHKIL